MIVRLEALEKKVKALQHLLGATDTDLHDAHAEAVQVAAEAEKTAQVEAAEDTKAARQTVAERLAARSKK